MSSNTQFSRYFEYNARYKAMHYGAGHRKQRKFEKELEKLEKPLKAINLKTKYSKQHVQMKSKIIIPDRLKDTEVHLLPCTIDHDGKAAVSTYFKPTPTGGDVEGLPILSAAFRGRNLAGCTLPLPLHYSGLVLQRKEEIPDDESAFPTTTTAPHTAWHAEHTFSSLSYWNHDATPLKSDGIQRCFEWAALAASFHSKIDPKDVDAMLVLSSE